MNDLADCVTGQQLPLVLSAKIDLYFTALVQARQFIVTFDA
jgi:hypothetical protein